MANLSRPPARALTGALLSFAFGTAACASGRSPDEAIAAARAAPARFIASCSPEALNAVIAQAGAEMEMEVERRSTRVGEPWVLHRSPRLLDVGLWWVVTVEPSRAVAGSAVIAVYGISEYRLETQTWETTSKDTELAYRAITLARSGADR